MNAKNIKILLGIFLLLLFIASIPLWQEYINLDKFLKPQSELNLVDFTPETTSEVKISQKDTEKITLKNENDQWKVNGFDASLKEVDRIFQSLAELKIDTIVSRNPEKQETFEVTEEKGILLTLKKGNETNEFVIGKRGSSPNSFYTRTKDGNTVYQLTGNLKNSLTQNVTNWRDKEVLAIQEENISKISVESDNNPFSISKNKEGKWQLSPNGEETTLPETIVSQLFSALNPLEATDFLSDDEVETFKQSSDFTIIQIFDLNETLLHTLKLVQKDDLWWGQVENKEVFYKIPKFNIEKIIKTPELKKADT